MLTKKEIERFRKMLLKKREEILSKTSNLQEVRQTHQFEGEGDEGDQAERASRQALAWRLLDKDRKLLAEIDHALRKIDSGEYGICEGTGIPIDKKRLLIRPWTRYSIQYKEKLEKQKKAAKVGKGTEINQLF